MSVPSATQINNLTYKYIQGIPYTSTGATTSTERAGSAFPKIASNNIMANPIPSTAPFVSSPNKILNFFSSEKLIILSKLYCFELNVKCLFRIVFNIDLE